MAQDYAKPQDNQIVSSTNSLHGDRKEPRGNETDSVRSCGGGDICATCNRDSEPQHTASTLVHRLSLTDPPHEGAPSVTRGPGTGTGLTEYWSSQCPVTSRVNQKLLRKGQNRGDRNVQKENSAGRGRTCTISQETSEPGNSRGSPCRPVQPSALEHGHTGCVTAALERVPRQPGASCTLCLRPTRSWCSHALLPPTELCHHSLQPAVCACLRSPSP